MSVVVHIDLDAQSQRFLATLQQASPRVQREILQTIDRENQFTVGQIQVKRLSKRGPDTLGVVSNRLRGSIRATKATLGAGGAIVSSIGSNVKYAGVHEFGFDGIVTVRAHSRRISQFLGHSATEAVFNPKTGKISKRTKKSAAKTTVQVREHKMHMKVPERAYIRRTIQERTGNYSAAIGEAVSRILGSE